MTGEGYAVPEQYIRACFSLISQWGASVLAGMADRLLQSEMEGNIHDEKGMELKDGTLFVMFRQVIKGFISGVTDETCDSRDCRAHRPWENFSR